MRIGLHLWTPIPVGIVSVAAGPVFASADHFTLRVRGRGGHGALPHLAVDPIVAAAQIVVALQTLVSREIRLPPRRPDARHDRGRHGFNIIADEVALTGTLRAYEASDREHLRARVGEVARGVAASMRAEAIYEKMGGCAACVNDAEMAALVRAAAEATVGPERVPGGDQRQAASDDMASFLAAAPAATSSSARATPSAASLRRTTAHASTSTNVRSPSAWRHWPAPQRRIWLLNSRKRGTRRRRRGLTAEAERILRQDVNACLSLCADAPQAARSCAPADCAEPAARTAPATKKPATPTSTATIPTAKLTHASAGSGGYRITTSAGVATMGGA